MSEEPLYGRQSEHDIGARAMEATDITAAIRLPVTGGIRLPTTAGIRLPMTSGIRLPIKAYLRPPTTADIMPPMKLEGCFMEGSRSTTSACDGGARVPESRHWVMRSSLDRAKVLNRAYKSRSIGQKC